jgi:hypothetical protein
VTSLAKPPQTSAARACEGEGALQRSGAKARHRGGFIAAVGDFHIT